jgi:choice-of-anchor A domain-containing protein
MTLQSSRGHSAVVCDRERAMALYNLVTLSDLWRVSQVQGQLLVGGNFASSIAASVASSTTTLPTSTSLEIAGNLAPGVPIRVDRGSVTVGSHVTIVKSTPWEYRVNKDRRIRLMDDRGGATITTNRGIKDHAMHVTRHLTEYSKRLSRLEADNTIRMVPLDDSTVAVILEVTNTDESNIAVFSIDASIVFGSRTRSIEIKNNLGAQMIIVNVVGLGDTAELQLSADLKGSWLNSSLGQSRTLWNLYNPAAANEIDLGTTVFKGALLAPFTHVQTLASMQGSVVAKTLTGTNVQLPLIDFSFCDNVVTSV